MMLLHVESNRRLDRWMRAARRIAARRDGGGRRIGSLAMVTFCVTFASFAHAQAIGCGDLRASVGPYDYRNVPAGPKYLVETGHFTPAVETLQGGSTGPIGGDLAYTLRVIPNHSRALLAMEKLGLKLQTERPPGSSHTVECFFERAIRFVPDDPMPHMIYAIYFKNRKKPKDALRELDTAEGLATPQATPDLDYNLGLLYFDLGNYEKSLTHAQAAYALGASFPGLKRKLQVAKKWRDPQPATGTP